MRKSLYLAFASMLLCGCIEQNIVNLEINSGSEIEIVESKEIRVAEPDSNLGIGIVSAVLALTASAVGFAQTLRS